MAIIWIFQRMLWALKRCFDVFAALPGIKTEYMLSLLNTPRTAQMTIWDGSRS